MGKWKGLNPPAQAGVKSPIGGRKTKSPVGGYKIGRKTRSRKMREVFG